MVEEGSGKGSTCGRRGSRGLCAWESGGVCVCLCVCVHTRTQVWVCLLAHMHKTLLSVSSCISMFMNTGELYVCFIETAGNRV